MLAYAAHRSIAAQRRSAPNALLLIVAAHVAAVAALMSAKMDLPRQIFDPPTSVDLIPVRDPPPPRPVESRVPRQPPNGRIDEAQPLIPAPTLPVPTVDPTANPPNLDQIIGSRVDPPSGDPLPMPTSVKIAARLLTPAAELRPPYPRSKLVGGDEAVLRLKLTIDERGRVIGVQPLGAADNTFLEAARRHLLAHWRYKPATEDGHVVSSSAVITLRFQLEG